MTRSRFPSHCRASILTACALVGAPALAAADERPDRCESPYFLVTSEPGDVDPLPLQESRADIHIAGVIAHVRIAQVYRNRGAHPLEAVYVFPGSTRAALFGMRMKIGNRTIEASVEERGAARRTYEAAVESGKTASLLEQERPNVFQMSVANILPGDVVRVEVDYTELLVPEDGVYELVYPTVVGPRYTGEEAEPEEWHDNPHLSEGAPEPYRFGLRATVSAGIPIQDLASPSHPISPRYSGPTAAELTLGSPGDGTRDFILRYRLRGREIQTGLLRFEEGAGPGAEKFFLLMMQPPARVPPGDIPAREYVFILDVSGSMFGFPLEVSKRLMRDLLAGLRPIDSFNLLFFSGGNYQLAPRSLRATPDNVARALRVFGEIQGGGGTELLGALRTALAMPSERGTARTFVALTDGYVSIEAEAFRLVRQNLGEASFFAFGIGTSVNRHLIEGLARAGLAEPFVVQDERAAPAAAQRFRKMIESPVLTDIRLEFRGFDVYDVEPPTVPDLLADRPLVLFGKYRGAPTGTLTVRGEGGAGAAFARTLRPAEARPDPTLRALPQLWARRRIAELRDLETFGGPPQRDSILRLGLRYHLMTEYTSFVAVDRVRRPWAGDLVTVRQPVPLPAGVSRHAVGDAEEEATGEGETIVVTGSAIARDSMSTPAPIVDALQRETVQVPGSAEDAPGPDIDVRSPALSPRTVGRYALQVEQRLEIADAGDAGAFRSPTLVRFGLTRSLEARLTSSLLSIDEDGTAPPDLAVGGKLYLLDVPRLTLGLLGDVRFDFDDATSDRRTWRGSLLADLAILPRLLVRANLAALFLDLDRDSRAGFEYATELSFVWPCRLVTFAGTSGVLADRSSVQLDAGASRVLPGGWLVGLSLGVGLSEAADDVVGALFLRWRL